VKIRVSASSPVPIEATTPSVAAETAEPLVKLPGVKAPSVKEGATAAVLTAFNTDSVAGVKVTVEAWFVPEI